MLLNLWCNLAVFHFAPIVVGKSTAPAQVQRCHHVAIELTFFLLSVFFWLKAVVMPMLQLDWGYSLSSAQISRIHFWRTHKALADDAPEMESERETDRCVQMSGNERLQIRGTKPTSAPRGSNKRAPYTFIITETNKINVLFSVPFVKIFFVFLFVRVCIHRAPK